MVSVVAVPEAGGVADVVTDHSYPVAPVAAVQLSIALLAVMLLMVRPVTGGHVVVVPVVVNTCDVHGEKLVALHCVRTCA